MPTPPRAPRMHVRLHPFDVVGDRLQVSWETDVPSRWQQRRSWYLEYHDLDLSLLDRRVLMEVVLALQLRIWAAEAREVVVDLPEPVARITLDFWCALTRTDNVRFQGPIDDALTYRPLAAPGALARPVAALRRRSRARRSRVAVTYGGGKDSTLAYRALLESRDPRDVVALHLTQLFTGGSRARQAGLTRSREVVLAGLRDLGSRAVVQTGATDMLATFIPGRRAPRPHVLLYTAALLPALVHHDVGDVVFSRTSAGYRTPVGPDGVLGYANPTGRPEHMAYLRRYLAHVLGRDIGAESTHYAINEYVSFRTLKLAYPNAFAEMVMCAATREPRRFCAQCTKCLEFAVFAASEGHTAPDLDHDALFASDAVTRVLDAAREEPDGTAEGPVWHPSLGSRSHFAAWCHALSRIDSQDAALGLSEGARAHLGLLVSRWGRGTPAVASLEEGAVRASGRLGAEVAGVAARHHSVVADPGRTVLVGDEPIGFDHTTPMPTPALDAWAARYGVPALTDVDARGVRLSVR